MQYPGFINGSAPVANPFVSSEMSMNLFPSPAETEGAVNTWHLLPSPGVQVYSAQAATLSTPGRALELWDGRCFAVIGGEFIELLAGGARIVRGTVAVNAEPATITYNGAGGRTILITSGGGAYTYDLDSHAYGPVVTPGAFAHAGAMMSGYHLVLDRSTSTIYQSALLNTLSWSGANLARRLIAGDSWVQMIAHGRELWLLGEKTSEVWYDAGTFPFAFAAHPSGQITTGCAAPWSAVSVGDSLLWLSKTKQGQGEVVMASGFSARPVSTFAVQAAIKTYSRIDDAVAWSYSDAGHLFYVINFPTGNATWVLDLSTMKWHQRGTWVSEQNTFQAWRPVYTAAFDNRVLALDSSGGEVFELSSTFGLDVDSRPIRRIRRAPHVAAERRVIFYSLFRLNLLAGQGLKSGQGSDPQIELMVSDDGGITWWSAGMESGGKRGEYTALPEWTRLGSSDNRVFEVQMSDPVPWMIVDAYLEAR